jgi:hypothetical protein
VEQKLAEKLNKEKLISDPEYRIISKYLSEKLFSLHWEIKTILYLGVLLLSTGAGLIIYQNIDSISHGAILAALGILCTACFFYCFRKRPPFTFLYSESPGLLFDYLLLLGCLLFLSFEGYFQYQYTIFGNKYGLAAIIPSIFFFYLAYRFDHKGVLSMGITGLAAWMGISVTPYEILHGDNNFSEMTMVWTGLAFGIGVCAAAFLLEEYNIKKHFTFTYLNFVTHVLFIASLAGLFMSNKLMVVFLLLLALFCIAFFLYGKRKRSFYFILISVVYGYIGITYLFFLALSEMGTFDMEILYFGIIYMMFSCGFIIYFFFNYKRLLKI